MAEAMLFEQVYAEEFRFVWRSLRRLGVREDDVSDAAQDVFLVVHRKLPEWQGRSKLTTWVYGICMRVASDRRKAAHVRREVVGSDVADRADGRANAGELLDRRGQFALLEMALDELPIDQRAVFTLFELEEMDGAQISEMLDIPIGTVWSRLRLAREAFRAAIQRRTARMRFESAVARGGP